MTHLDRLEVPVSAHEPTSRESLSRPLLARITQVAAVALARGFTFEAEPVDGGGGAFLRMHRQRDSGSVYVNGAGEFEGWRTSGRPALERLKATLEQLKAVRA